MQKYVEDQNLTPKEKKVCCSGTKVCKDQLLIKKKCYKNVNAGRKI
jgi:hypothetical protein